MKKTLAVLAVLAVAAAAQAELLNTWTFSAGRQSGNTKADAVNKEQVSFGDLTLVNLTAGATGAAGGHTTFSSYNWTGDSAIQFTVSVNPDYMIAGAGVTVQGINGVNGAPTPLQWKLDNVAKGDAWTIESGTDPQTAAQSASFGDIAAGDHIAALTYSGTGRIGSTTAAASSTANVRLFTNLQFTGDIKSATAVPEPATMGLLGLGALAMALRRKLRK